MIIILKLAVDSVKHFNAVFDIRTLQVCVETMCCHVQQLPRCQQSSESLGADHPAAVDRRSEWLYLQSLAILALRLVEPGDILTAKATHLLVSISTFQRKLYSTHKCFVQYIIRLAVTPTISGFRAEHLLTYVARRSGPVQMPCR